MSVITSHVSVVEAFFDRLRAGDLPGVQKCLHPQMEIAEPAGLPYGLRYHGHDGVAQLVAAVSELYEFEIHSVEARAWGEEVVGVVEATFVSRKTGRSLDTRVVEIYTFTDGLISHADIFPKDTRAIYELTL
jgi:ketosteroid isomerase-like protein